MLWIEYLCKKILHIALLYEINLHFLQIYLLKERNYSNHIANMIDY